MLLSWLLPYLTRPLPPNTTCLLPPSSSFSSFAIEVLFVSRATLFCLYGFLTSCLILLCPSLLSLFFQNGTTRSVQPCRSGRLQQSSLPISICTWSSEKPQLNWHCNMQLRLILWRRQTPASFYLKPLINRTSWSSARIRSGPRYHSWKDGIPFKLLVEISL